MKRIHALLGCVLLTASHAANAGSPQLDFINRIVKYSHYAEKNQQAVWPGFHPLNMPTVIQFQIDDGHVSAYALNFKPNALAWQSVGSNYPIYYLEDAKPLNIEFEHDGQIKQVDGQNSFVDVELEKFEEVENVQSKLLNKRAAYYLKNESSINAKNAGYLQTNYDNFNNIDLLKLFYLEDAALTLSQQDDTARAEEALRDAVAIHQYRNQLSSVKSRQFENGNEIVVGTPAFISWTSQQLSEADYRKMSQRTGCMPLSGLLGPGGMTDCAMQGLPSFASAVYGHALDKKLSGQAWKQRVENEFKSISALAIEHYHFSDEQARMMAEQAKKKSAYHYDRIEKIVDSTMTHYLKGMAIAQEQYKALPGIELRTDSEFGEMIIFLSMFMPTFSDIYTVNNHTTQLVDVDMENLSTESSDQVFEIKHLPAMIINIAYKGFEKDQEHSKTLFKIDENTELKLDDVTVIASEFLRGKKRVAFQRFYIKDSHIHIDVKGAGVLDASDGTLQLKIFENGNKAGRLLDNSLIKQWLQRHSI